MSGISFHLMFGKPVNACHLLTNRFKGIVGSELFIFFKSLSAEKKNLYLNSSFDNLVFELDNFELTGYPMVSSSLSTDGYFLF